MERRRRLTSWLAVVMLVSAGAQVHGQSVGTTTSSGSAADTRPSATPVNERPFLPEVRFDLDSVARWDLDGGAECRIAKRDEAGRARAGKGESSGGPASMASAGFDATYYALDITVDDMVSGRIHGTTRVEGRVIVPQLTALDLDLDSAMHVTGVRDSDGSGLAFSHGAAVLSITLPTPAAEGQVVTVWIDYQGIPPGSGFGSFGTGRRANGDPYVWTLSEPYGAREWWPCKDHPADKADSVDIAVTVPQPLRVGSNGLLVDQHEHADGTTTWVWKHRYPISTYLVSIAGGVYDVTEQTYHRPDSLAARYGPLDLPLLHYAYAGTGAYEGSVDGTVLTQGWKRVTDMLEVFESWYGPYPFAREKYGHAHFSWGGAMEHQTMTSMTSAYVGTVAHELAHQWYGDAVSPAGWPDLWLNEGFATFGEFVWWEGRKDLYPDTYEQIFDIYFDRALRAEGTLVLEDTSDVNTMFTHARVYAKGAMILHMIRSIVGDATMRTILQTWADDPARQYRVATTDDFRRHVEAVTARSWSTFFEQWVTHGTGYPVYSATWSVRPSPDGYVAEVTMSQLQGEDTNSNIDVFEMPIELVFQTDAGPRRIVVDQDERVQSYTIPLDARPNELLVDPDRKILRGAHAQVTASAPPEGLPGSTRIVDLYPTPTHERIHVMIDRADSSALRLDIFDLLGRRMIARELGEAAPGGLHEILDVSRWAPGVYFARLSGRTVTDSRRFVVGGHRP